MSKQGLVEIIRSQSELEIRTIQKQSLEKIRFLENQIKKEEEMVHIEAARLGKRAAQDYIEQSRQGYQKQILQTMQEMQWKTIDSIFRQTETRLKQIRNTPETYRFVFRRLLFEAVDKIMVTCSSEVRFVIHIDPRDQPMLDEVLSSLPDSVVTENDLMTWGGVVVTNQDGSITVDNRLEERLQRCRPVFIEQFIPEFGKLFKNNQ